MKRYSRTEMNIPLILLTDCNTNIFISIRCLKLGLRVRPTILVFLMCDPGPPFDSFQRTVWLWPGTYGNYLHDSKCASIVAKAPGLESPTLPNIEKEGTYQGHCSTIESTGTGVTPLVAGASFNHHERQKNPHFEFAEGSVVIIRLRRRPFKFARGRFWQYR